MPTKSEQLFEELCARCKISCKRIAEKGDSGERSPDYEGLDEPWEPA